MINRGTQSSWASKPWLLLQLESYAIVVCTPCVSFGVVSSDNKNKDQKNKFLYKYNSKN